jgi:chromosome partitioning protein
MKKAAIALLNAKGGVGKTTGAINIASMAAALGKKVLICDLDPQMNATQQLGFDNIEPQHTLAEVTYNSELEPLIIRNVAKIPGLDLLPSHYQLAYLDEGILQTGTWLRRRLAPFRARYDLIFFDCSVHLGLMTRNALAASNGIIIPTQAEKHSVMGLPHLLARSRRVFEETEVVNPWAYILINMIRLSDLNDREWHDRIREQYEGAVLKSMVRNNTDLKKSATGGMPIVVFDNRCSGYEDFLNVTQELLTALEEDTPHLRVVGSRAVNE